MQIYPYNVQIYTYKHIYILLYLRMHVCVCVNVYVYIYIHIFVYDYVYTYIHIFVHAWICKTNTLVYMGIYLCILLILNKMHTWTYMPTRHINIFYVNRFMWAYQWQRFRPFDICIYCINTFIYVYSHE